MKKNFDLTEKRVLLVGATGILGRVYAKSLVDNGNVKNLQIFNNEIILDIQISNPSLHYKNKITDQCINLIHQKQKLKRLCLIALVLSRCILLSMWQSEVQ